METKQYQKRYELDLIPHTMKNLILTAAFLFTALLCDAQGPIGKGQSQFNAGFGLSSWGIPVYMGFDVGIHRDVTIGGEATFRSFHDNWLKKRYNHTIIGISGNVNYHFNNLLKLPAEWDFYAGLNIGFYIWNSPSDYLGSNTSGLGLGGQFGGRYFFTEKIGANLEFGGGNAFSGGKIGITLKL